MRDRTVLADRLEIFIYALFVVLRRHAPLGIPFMRLQRFANKPADNKSLPCISQSRNLDVYAARSNDLPGLPLQVE